MSVKGCISEPIKFDKVGDSTIDKLYACVIKYLS